MTELIYRKPLTIRRVPRSDVVAAEPALRRVERVIRDAVDVRSVFDVAAAVVELSTDRSNLSEDPFSSA